MTTIAIVPSLQQANRPPNVTSHRFFRKQTRKHDDVSRLQELVPPVEPPLIVEQRLGIALPRRRRFWGTRLERWSGFAESGRGRSRWRPIGCTKEYSVLETNERR